MEDTTETHYLLIPINDLDFCKSIKTIRTSLIRSQPWIKFGWFDDYHVVLFPLYIKISSKNQVIQLLKECTVLLGNETVLMNFSGLEYEDSLNSITINMKKDDEYDKLNRIRGILYDHFSLNLPDVLIPPKTGASPILKDFNMMVYKQSKRIIEKQKKHNQNEKKKSNKPWKQAIIDQQKEQRQQQREENRWNKKEYKQSNPNGPEFVNETLKSTQLNALKYSSSFITYPFILTL